MSHEDNYVERALRVGEGLTGLSLEQLGFEPRLEDLAAEQRSLLVPMTSSGWTRSPRKFGTEACFRQTAGRPEKASHN
jgi:hypothetical protein